MSKGCCGVAAGGAAIGGGILADHQIKQLIKIEPFVDARLPEVREAQKGKLSYGLSCYGYDVRIGNKFKIFTNTKHTHIDPKNFDPDAFVSVEVEDYCVIPPNSFVLAESVEYMEIPRNVLVVCVGKSTYARCGIIVNVTPGEPCLSADSEILTEHGWVPMPDVKIGDLVLTRHESGVAEYQPVERKQERFHHGNLLHFRSRRVDQLVTPDHKLFVWRRNTRNNTYHPMTTEAENVFGKYGHSFDRSVEWRGTPHLSDEIDINGVRLPFDPFLKFLGCWLGDGSAYRGTDGGYSVKLAAVTKERKFTYYQDVLKALGITNAVRRERGWQFYSKPIATYLMKFGHAKDKYIDRAYMNLPPDKLRLIIDGLIESDGNRETMTFATSSRRLADDFQEIVFKSGAGAIVRRVQSTIRDKPFTAYKVRVVNGRKRLKTTPKSQEVVPYTGMVYDVTVPNHVFLCRRNGKPAWTGNCWRGKWTIEISNTAPLPAKIYANEGIMQALFFMGSAECDVSYADKKGKYQNQTGLTLPTVTK